MGIFFLWLLIIGFFADIQSALDDYAARGSFPPKRLPQALDFRRYLTNTRAIAGGEKRVGSRVPVELLPFCGKSLDTCQRPLLCIPTSLFTKGILDNDRFER